MSLELREITSEEEWLKWRLEDITSTEVSALFDCCPYMTKFELWHRMKDSTLIEALDAERIRWGQRLEPAIAKGLAEDNGLLIRPYKYYARDTELGMGSSFDFETIDSEGNPTGFLEIKNVDSLVHRNKWEENEAPLHIELQCQAQMMVTGRKHIYIGALIGGNTGKLLPREPNEKLFKQIEFKVREFRKSLEQNNPPKPSEPGDYDLISKMNQYSDPGLYIEADMHIEELVRQWETNRVMLKKIELEKKRLKAELLQRIGAAEKCVGDGFSISAKLGRESVVPSFIRRATRNFRVNIKKEFV